MVSSLACTSGSSQRVLRTLIWFLSEPSQESSGRASRVCFQLVGVGAARCEPRPGVLSCGGRGGVLCPHVCHPGSSGTAFHANRQSPPPQRHSALHTVRKGPPWVPSLGRPREPWRDLPTLCSAKRFRAVAAGQPGALTCLWLPRTGPLPDSGARGATHGSPVGSVLTLCLLDEEPQAQRGWPDAAAQLTGDRTGAGHQGARAPGRPVSPPAALHTGRECFVFSGRRGRRA